MEGFVPSDIIYHIINIIVLFLLLRLILWRPVQRFLRARAERIAAELDSAEAARRAAAEAKLEHERKLDELEERGHEILRSSQKRASEQSSGIVAAAREQAERIVAEARERTEEERRRAVEHVQHDVAVLASELASRIMRGDASARDGLSAAPDILDSED